MPSTKLLKERIESIQDTMKITNAMYLISSSKLRKAPKNYQAVSPYFERMQMTMTRVLPHLPEEPVHPFFHTRNPESPRRAYLVLTADKGMAGAYNQNLLKFRTAAMTPRPAFMWWARPATAPCCTRTPAWWKIFCTAARPPHCSVRVTSRRT